MKLLDIYPARDSVRPGDQLPSAALPQRIRTPVGPGGRAMTPQRWHPRWLRSHRIFRKGLFACDNLTSAFGALVRSSSALRHTITEPKQPSDVHKNRTQAWPMRAEVAPGSWFLTGYFCSKNIFEVELWGFEPQTSCMPSAGMPSTAVHRRRSTSCTVHPSAAPSAPVAVLPCCTPCEPLRSRGSSFERLA